MIFLLNDILLDPPQKAPQKTVICDARIKTKIDIYICQKVDIGIINNPIVKLSEKNNYKIILAYFIAYDCERY